jgi:hypothetical protein
MSETSGLETGVTLGKDSVNTSVKPILIEARRFTIFCKPSEVRCSLLLTNSTACLKRI